MFNLPPPPGFRGLHPDLPVTMYHRRLPHWRQSGATYFVTFRLADALPQVTINYLNRVRNHWLATHPSPRSEKQWESLAKLITQKVEVCLDKGYGCCHLRNSEFAENLATALQKFEGQRYSVFCWTIMPNHCHLIIRPFEGWDLEKLLQGIKGSVARNINLATGGSEKIWQEESYDRIIRDEEHLYRVVQYIGSNPARAGFEKSDWIRWISPDWQKAGWGFVDREP